MSDFTREALKERIAALAAKGVYIGTSSWKYAGWCGMVYEEQRYITRGKFSDTRFERQCLAEYAEVFKTVSVDAGYYRIPDERYISGLVSQVTPDFLFTFKVTDEFTIKRFSNLPRFGARAGKPNENFLNADLFASAFIPPFENFKQNIGMFIFEFSRFYPSDYQHGRDFVADLDRFLGGLPTGWRYGIEIRNKTFLQPEYFAMLAKHGAAHVFNSWTAMPAVHEQMATSGAVTTNTFAGARLLLKPGRTYEQAVNTFAPEYEPSSMHYSRIREINEDVRRAAAELIRRGLQDKAIHLLFIYVNNRLEGNAPMTIWAILESLQKL